jgi:hypothetical protein
MTKSQTIGENVFSIDRTISDLRKRRAQKTATFPATSTPRVTERAVNRIFCIVSISNMKPLNPKSFCATNIDLLCL